MEDFLEVVTHAEVERTELADEMIRRKELNFRRRLSEVVCKSPYAALKETFFVVNDKENGDSISVDIY